MLVHSYSIPYDENHHMTQVVVDKLAPAIDPATAILPQKAPFYPPLALRQIEWPMTFQKVQNVSRTTKKPARNNPAQVPTLLFCQLVPRLIFE